MKFPSFLLTLVLGSASCVAAGAADAPRVFLWNAADLVAARASLAGANAPLQPALAKLRADAERALKLTPPSVMDKPLTAASGDKHDYFSFGPYWWPDPAKPNGLPYIRRDGEVNPATRSDTDDSAFGRMSGPVETLALAYWFTGEARYAEKAAEFARVWFLAPATRMNPNLQHAQAIPGVNDGRGIGIIESRRLAAVIEALALLADSPAWTAADQAAFRAWLDSFYGWLTTSANGRDERNEENNHGSWYDAQAAHLALTLGRDADAKKILTEGLTRRLARQIEPDGSQPLELARTKSLDYSCFNLEALFTCARLGESAGVDWWKFATADGRSLRAALAYLAPYADPAKPWPKSDLKEADRNRLIILLARYVRQREDAPLRAVFTRFSASLEPASRWRLTNNLPPAAEPAAATAAKESAPANDEGGKAAEVTPVSLPGSQAFAFRQIGDDAVLRLHVVKPKKWAKSDRRACVISYFGGGWNTGTPERSIGWAKWAASQGMVGVAPDYRTRDRHGAAPEDCVSDARAAMRWIVTNARELGIDPKRIIVLGGSAGGHVAAWNAIPAPGPGGDDPAPTTLPAAMILLNPVTDTKEGGYGGPKRFGKSAARALACSVLDQMPAKMPPSIVFHSTGDTTVPYANSVAFRDKLVSNGNRCELVTFEGLGHSYNSSKFGAEGKAADTKTKKDAAEFLASLGLIAPR
jgi:acetyl esterase/lipase